MFSDAIRPLTLNSGFRIAEQSDRINIKDRVIADTQETPTTLLDELVALDREQRCEVAEQLRKIAETFAEVPDGRRTAHTLGLLAHWLDPA